MSVLQIFQLEKNNEDIRKTVLTNAIKMLTDRKVLSKDKESDNIKKITSMQSDDYTYIIDINNYANENDKKYIIKIFNYKITGIAKQSNLSEFLNKYKDMPKLIVVKSITPKLAQQIKTSNYKTEVFVESFLMINLVDNVLVPEYEILDRNSDDYKTFYEQYQCKKKDVPRMYETDPVAKYYNLSKGDVVRVIRPSETAGRSILYRLVI